MNEPPTHAGNALANLRADIESELDMRRAAMESAQIGYDEKLTHYWQLRGLESALEYLSAYE